MVKARGILASAVSLAVIGVVASVLLPLVPAWPFVLFEHFRFQFVWGGVLVVAACGALRIRGWFDVALIATLVNALWIVPDLTRDARPLADGVPLRVLVLNVHTSSTSFTEVARLIDDTKPDVVGLVEVDTRWLAELAPTVARFPQRIEKPDDRGNFGVALYTTLPMTATTEDLGSLLPTAVATLDVHGAPLAVLLTHPIPPVDTAALRDQTSQLEAVARRARELGTAVIMGDLNATPWSRPFRDLVAATGFCDSRAGFGLQASFPAGSSIMRIPIDHMLVSCSIGVASRRIERDVGSDHLPVVVDLVIPRH
jgi:endonuclease/exonuclease/phosphatase (EEP) superfamily protein YafD